MKGFIIAVIVLAIGYGAVQWMEIFKANSDFAEKVDGQLNFVERAFDGHGEAECCRRREGAGD